MSQDNQFHQYGYDHYLKAPRKKSKSAESEGIVSRVMSNLQSPAVATVALLAAGAVFAGIIIMAYPSGDKSNQEIPIVRADLRPVKSVPEERGGMEVPNQDSTILAAVGQGTTNTEDVAPLENLLAPQPSEDILSKEQALEQAMADENPYGQQGEEGTAPESALKPEPVPTLIQEAKELEGQKSASADFEIKSPDASSILQKIEPAAEETASEEVIPAAPSDSSKPTKLHAAATSPETIEFVRGVMNETETEAANSGTVKEQAEVKEIGPSEELASAAQVEEPVAPEAVEDIKPAAGAADHAITIESGSYYVQLASITDSSRAEKEYTKLQKKFSVLGSLGYRVQEANLDKGTFYRIQAGPISKASANAICKDIKAQSGGCIVAK